MNKAKTFGSVLSRIRKERGFSGAYKFFTGVGGSKSLGFSFVSYWDLERGKKLPKGWRLKEIMNCLGVKLQSAEGQELIRAYFNALSGSEELLQALSAPAQPGADLPSRELAETATHRALAQLSVSLTLEQWKLRTRDAVTNICQSYLAETAGWVTIQELAEATKVKPEALRKALKALAAGGLAEFAKDKARGKFTGKVIQLLPMTRETRPIREALRRYWDELVADSERVALKRTTVRMSRANLEIFRQHLERAVNLAAIYGNAAENRQDSALYCVDDEILKLFPKD